MKYIMYICTHIYVHEYVDICTCIYVIYINYACINVYTISHVSEEDILHIPGLTGVLYRQLETDLALNGCDS